MESWSYGVMLKPGPNRLGKSFAPLLHYSITPSLHYSITPSLHEG